MLSLSEYHKMFTEHLDKYTISAVPENLYAPVHYILSLGGKRIRPILTLVSTDIFSGSPAKALDAALAGEVFHNFSLVHDDIMDSADLRRGNITVHKKWDSSTGILSGDVMLILAYQIFENYEPDIFVPMASLFSKTAIRVCEGQQLDIDFETRKEISLEEYLLMITCKTAELIGAAMKMGAIIADASLEQQEKIYDFGKNLGIAFQLQDDYLDCYGNENDFGKKIGGDIIEKKKTFLYLKTLELVSKEVKSNLISLYNSPHKDNQKKIILVKEIYNDCNIENEVVLEIKKYTDIAFKILDSLDLPKEKHEFLHNFGDSLMKRKI
ncbi:MAG: polyprenyl synthetase family protein [Flavobacteriales bacterium]|mgnify:FL=1|nr:MAG: polyprenyl synthetase family protein [Flavobacteriales bacterium]|tara:strand:+ start:1876 stop:2850 length:975 start_codon:yes stop_codon:yes gene_type:complete